MAAKIVMKTLKGDNFEVEVDPSMTIQDLKKVVAEVRTEFPAEQQKLIYSGRILSDESTVAQAGVKPGEFVVVMVTKPKAAPPATSPAATPAPAEPAPTPAPPPTAGGAATNYDTAASNLVTGIGMSSAVAHLCEMGFERADVEKCLRAAFNNPDRAVEYLMSGIPENVLAPEDEAAPAPPAEGTTGGAPLPAQTGRAAPFPAFGTGGAAGAGANSGVAALAELRNSPMFPELARLVTQNPQALAQMVPALAQSNPGLVQAILQNPEAFQQMLQEASGAQGESTDPVEAMLAAAGGEGGGAAGGGEPMVVELTDDQRQAVDRLCALGFDQDMALQAYIFCDKNEELAANFLFDSGNMED